MQRVTKHSVTEAYPSCVFKTACDTWYWLLLGLVYFRCCFWGSGGGSCGVQRVGRGLRPGLDSSSSSGLVSLETLII